LVASCLRGWTDAVVIEGYGMSRSTREAHGNWRLNEDERLLIEDVDPAKCKRKGKRKVKFLVEPFKILFLRLTKLVSRLKEERVSLY
jgi:hypothetical protein